MKDFEGINRVVIMANDVDRLGGIGRFMNQMAIEFHRLDFSVELVGVTPPPVSEYHAYVRPPEIPTTLLWDEPAPEKWTLNTKRHRRNPARRLRNRKRRQLRATAVEKLRKLLVEWGPQTLIVCTQVLGMEHIRDAGYKAHDKAMPRIVGQYHGSFEMCSKTGDLRRVVRGYSEIEKFVCLNAQDADSFRKASLNNTHWIANPVARPSEHPLRRGNVFVAVARYDKQKSLEYFLRAWKLIEAQHPDWRVELYGEGVLRSQLQSVIADEMIPRARLMGMSTDVGKVFSASKIHVLSSQYEGLPIAIVEAGLAGVPTISFDCAPGIHDLILDGVSGQVVPLNNIRALANAMDKLASDDRLLDSMSQKAIQHSEQYLPDRIIGNWTDLLAEINR